MAAPRVFKLELLVSLSNANCDDMQLLHMPRILSDVIMRHLLLGNVCMAFTLSVGFDAYSRTNTCINTVFV